ncbi:hypothetical protein BsWGS_02782 [Bradybaena similaris]
MGSAVVKPLARRRGKIKKNKVPVGPANGNEEENGSGNNESSVNCKVNPLADSAKNLPQPFFGKPCKVDDGTQSNRKVCCTYVFFSGKAKSYDSDEELDQVQLVRKKNVSPSQDKIGQQKGTHLSENVKKLLKPCLAPKCADPLSQFLQSDNDENLLQPQPSCYATAVCSEINMSHGEALYLQTPYDKIEHQRQEKFAAKEDTSRICKDETAENASLRDQDVSYEDCAQLPEYDFLEEVKIINTNHSFREPFVASSPIQNCRQSSETKATPTASCVGLSSSKTKHSPEALCQQRLDVGDQVFIKPSPSVEYTKSQCQGAGESIPTHLSYTHNICLLSSEVQKRCFQSLCRDFDLKNRKDSSHNQYRCSSLCTMSPSVEGNTSVNATNATVKSEAGETLECNENNAINSSDSFGDVTKQSLLPGFRHSSSTLLNGTDKGMKCAKGSDCSSLNHPRVEDVLAVGEEFVDEIEEVFLQPKNSQFAFTSMSKCVTPVQEKDARLYTFSKPCTLESPRSVCSSKPSEANYGWRRSRPGSSVKASIRSSEAGKANITPCLTGSELRHDIFNQVAPCHRLSNTMQTLINSELEYGPGYIEDVLSKGSSMPSRACSSRESLHSIRALLMQSLMNGDTLPKDGTNLTVVCPSKDSLHSAKLVVPQPNSDHDIMHNKEKAPSIACSPKSFLHAAVPTQSTSNKDFMLVDCKEPVKFCFSNESLTNQRAIPTQSVVGKEVMSRAPSRICSKDSLHSAKAVLSRHFLNNEIMLTDSRTSLLACSSKSSQKSTTLAQIQSTLNPAETPKGSEIVPKASSCDESLHMNREVLPESISSSEIIPTDKGVLSTTCTSKVSLHSARLAMTQFTPINGEVSKDCRVPSRQCSSIEPARSSVASHTNLPQNNLPKDSMNPPRGCSSKESLQSTGVIQIQSSLLTCTEAQNVSSKHSSPGALPDITAVNIVPSRLSLRPPSSKRSTASSEHCQGRSRPESNKPSATLSDFVEMTVRPHSRLSKQSSNASRPSSSFGRRLQPNSEASAGGDALLKGISVITRTRIESHSLHEAASLCDGSRQLNVKGVSEAGTKSLQISPEFTADISKSEVTNKSPSNACASKRLQNSETPAVASEDTSSFAHFCLPNKLILLNQTAKSFSPSTMSSRTDVNDELEGPSHEHMATPKETTIAMSSSACPLTNSIATESTNGHPAVKVENSLAIDANSSASMAVAPPYCLSPDKIDNIRRQLYEEGFAPAEREGGVAFFIPVTEDGLQPQTDTAVVAERLTKTKKASLNYEERMFLANINRQVQLSKRKEFAVRDIRNVKGATSSSDGSDRTKQTDDVDEFDVAF